MNQNNINEEALSNYWRTVKKSSVPMELVDILRAMKLMSTTFDEDMEFAWMSKNAKPSDELILLNQAPLSDKNAPMDGIIVDVVVGEAINDIGHKKLNSNEATDLRRVRVDNMELAKLVALILEDSYVTRELGSVSRINAEYMAETRKYYAPPQEYVDHASTFLNNIDNPQPMRALALADVLNSVLNYGVIPSKDVMRRSWLESLVRICAKIPTEVKGNPTQRREKHLIFYSLLERLFKTEMDKADAPQGGEGESEGNTGKKGVWEPMVGALGEQKNTEASAKAQAKMAKAVQQADAIDAANAEDLSQDVMQALGAGGVENNACVIIDAEIGDKNDLKYVEREAERLARLLEMYREMRFRRLRGEKSGRISQRRLYRAGIPLSDTNQEVRIFDRRIKMEDTGLAVCLVLDQSGSIDSAWERVLIPIAAGLTTGVHKDIDIWACSYTTGYAKGIHGTVVSVLFRPQWKSLRTGVGPQGGTPSAVGLVAGETLLKQSRKTNKLLIHVTDGYPGSVGHLDGFESCHKALEYLTSKKIKTATLFVNGYDSGYYQSYNEKASYAFGDHLAYVKSFEGVPAAVEKILTSTVKEITHQDRM